MERKFLEELGLEKEVINRVMDAHSADIGKHKKQIEDLIAERNGFECQLQDVKGKLNAFNGVDVDALRNEISTLKQDLEAKETSYKQQLADRDFHDLLNSAIAEAKGRNVKSITALLDVASLKASKNQKEDIDAALKALRESDAYQFDDTEDQTTPAKVSTGGEHTEPNSTSVDSFLAAAMKGSGLNTGKED